jgi:hypothetical protein
MNGRSSQKYIIFRIIWDNLTAVEISIPQYNILSEDMRVRISPHKCIPQHRPLLRRKERPRIWSRIRFLPPDPWLDLSYATWLDLSYATLTTCNTYPWYTWSMTQQWEYLIHSINLLHSIHILHEDMRIRTSIRIRERSTPPPSLAEKECPCIDTSISV